MDLPARVRDGETYLTTDEAAALMRVAKSTVSRWKAKGYLEPVPGCPPRKPLYAYSAVCEAEWTARQNAIRASGTAAQVRRDREAPDG